MHKPQILYHQVKTKAVRLTACSFSVEGYTARSTSSRKAFRSAYLGQPFHTPYSFVIL